MENSIKEAIYKFLSSLNRGLTLYFDFVIGLSQLYSAKPLKFNNHLQTLVIFWIK